MRKHMRTFLGCLLSIALAVSNIPISASAEETSQDVSQEVVATTEDTSSLEEPEIISELTEKRDEITKYFAMSDGTIKACIYPQNIHYLEDGKYEEIDNTLVKTDEDDKSYYENKKNSFSVKIPESYTDDYIEFSDENGYVKFKLQGASNKKIEKSAKKQFAEETDLTIAQHVNDRATFKSIKGDVDIEYDLAGNKLKETIVLNKKTKKSFVFDIKTSAAKVLVNNDNSVSFYDSDGVEIYTIASPYMTDAAGEYSNAVETKLIVTENSCTLTYKPDYEWLSAKEREYPVRIDPTLVQAIYKDTVTDTYVGTMQTASSNDIRGGWDVLNIGRRTQTTDGSQIVLRGYVRFDIPSEIGSNDCIVEAKLDLVHYTGGGDSVNGTQIDVHELTSSFSEGNTWWGNQPSYDPIITDYAIVNTGNTFSGSTLSYDSYNLTRLVNKWHNGESNYGIVLKYHDDTADVSTTQQVFYFAKQSTYYSSISKFVEITYRNTTGLEDYWSYTTQDFGQYGTGYVNNYNGNLVYVHEDVTFNSLINGFTLSHVYNTNLSDKGMGYYGSGWRLNLVQKLEPVTVDGNSSVKYKYTDGDGTEHYFVETDAGTIVDEDGLGYTFSSINETTDSGTTPLSFQIKSKDGTILKFDSWFFLRRIIDSNGNTISLNYGPGETYDLNKLTSVSTSSGGKVVLTYDNANLVSITDNSGKDTVFKYNSEKLSEIHYPDGTILKFEYCSGTHWLNNVVSPDGSKIHYENYPSTGKISATEIVGTDGTESSIINFEYSQNQTRVIDSYNRGITYQFDAVGRATCVYDDEQNIYNQTYNATVTNSSGIFRNNKLSSLSNGAAYINNMLVNAVFSNGLTDWGFYRSNAEFSVSSDVGLITSNSIKITSDSENIDVISQIPSGIATRTYTYSGYIKTENVQSENNGAGLEVITSGNDGNKFYYSDFITGTTDTEIDNGFRHVSVSFTLEEGESIARVTAGLYNASGTVYIDSLQLEEGDTANQINLIDNSSFERNSGMYTTPTGYNGNLGNYGDGGASTSVSRSGSTSCKMVGRGIETRSVSQVINLSGKVGDIYSVGGWAKANAVSNHKQDKTNDADFILYVRSFCNDGTEEWINVKFNEYISDWQCVSKTFALTKDYSRIQIYCSYDFNGNAVYFDNIFLYRDTMQSYTYDKSGNIISTSDYASQNETFQYNGNSNLAKLISPTGSSYEYLYDSNNNMTSARSGEGVAYDVTYDSQGNVISTSIGSHPYSTSVQDGKTYYIRLKSTGKYLAVEGSGTTLITNIIQETFTGADNQKWTLEQTTDGYYCLHPAYLPGMSMDVTNGSSSTDGNIAIYTNNLSDAQKYYITPQNDYTYQLKAKCYTDKLVTVEFTSAGNNNVSAVTKWGENNADQEWYFEEVEQSPEITIVDGEIYQFRARHSGKYIDVDHKGTTAGTLIMQNEQNYGNNQRFIVHRYKDTDYYTLSPVHASEMLFEVSAELGNYGYTYLILGDSVISERKLFKFEYNEEKQGFYIIPKFDETLALDVADYSLNNAASLIFTGKAPNVNRFFIAEKFSDTITSSATYRDNGKYPHTVTDSRGNTTTYTYDTSRGLQTAVTDAKNNTIEYTYNSLNDRLESVKSGDSTVSYQYETAGALKKITAPSGTIYSFNYDTLGRQTQILVGSQVLSETVYRDNFSSLVSRFNYGNGAYKTYTYDNQDRLISESLNGTTRRTYLYDKSGNAAEITDLLANVTTKFNYDLIGRIVGIKASDGQKLNFVYDKYNRLSLSKWTLGDISLSSGYVYGDTAVAGQKTGLIYGVNLNGTQKLGYQYDELSRLQRRILSTETPFVSEYSYLEGKDYGTTTTLIKTVKNGTDTLEYTYDELGNITTVSKNGIVIEQYSYDESNQLKSAVYGGDTYLYSYDNGGNITEVKKNGTVIKNYAYGNADWKDLLTNFNGTDITYDEIGNPLTYRNGLSFTWQNGRQLSGISQNGNALAAYTYNADGLRTSKTVNGITTEYYWLNGTLQGQKTGDEYILFLYDENGSAYGFVVKNGEEQSYYYYEFNLQGDIIGIIDSTGTKVVEYTYGAWGDILSVTGTLADTIGQKNPLRYRGYYYDAETGFYYVSSRYYDPEIGRFINADGEISGIGGNILGYNLFAYCFNNPVNYSDPTGNWPKLSTIFKGVAIAAAAVAAVAVCVVAAPVIAGVGVASGVAAAATSIATTALCVSGVAGTAAIVTSVVENTSRKKNTRDQSVYVMKNQSDEVAYVGRTNDPSRRQREHEKDISKADLQPLEVVFTGLTKNQARVVEQVLISAYGINNLYNARREIAVGNISKYSEYVGSTISLFGSFYESEMLNLMGR